MYSALDELLLHSTQWNYTASNRNDLRIGDGWNQEDLSIFSADQCLDPGDPDSGGRALEGFCRPFARRVQGRIRRMQFDRAAHGSGWNTTPIRLLCAHRDLRTAIAIPRRY